MEPETSSDSIISRPAEPSADDAAGTSNAKPDAMNLQIALKASVDQLLQAHQSAEHMMSLVANCVLHSQGLLQQVGDSDFSRMMAPATATTPAPMRPAKASARSSTQFAGVVPGAHPFGVTFAAEEEVGDEEGSSAIIRASKSDGFADSGDEDMFVGGFDPNDPEAPDLSSSLSAFIEPYGTQVSRVSRIAGTFDKDDLKRKQRAEKKAQLLKATKNRQNRMISQASTASLAENTRAFGYALAKLQESIVRVVEGHYFNVFISVVVIINLIFVAVQVEHSIKYPNSDPAILLVLEYTFTVIFVTELSMRVIAEGKHFFVGSQWAWNLMDGAIVMFALMDIVIHIVQSSGSSDTNSNFSYLRIVRIARMLRIVRVARLMRFFRAVRILIYSILSTLKSLLWTLVLLVIIIYAFSIVFTSISAEYLLESDTDLASESSSTLATYFGSIPRSIFTLFKAITGGLDWHILTEVLSDVGWVMVLLFVVYISFTIFAVLNVVTGVFCHSALESAARDQDVMVQAQVADRERYIERAKVLFKDMDADELGTLTLAELEEGLNNDNVKAYFEFLDLAIADAWTLFRLIDVDEICVVSLEDFVTGCLRLKGSAKAIDMATLMYQNQKILALLEKKQKNDARPNDAGLTNRS